MNEISTTVTFDPKVEEEKIRRALGCNGNICFHRGSILQRGRKRIGIERIFLKLTRDPVDKYRSIFKYLRCYAIFPRIGYSIRDMALPAHRIDENLSSEIRFYEN